ncbi:MAG: G-D-S-L family lipolytic protein [Flavobacteriaceae bacterium]|nr:G-D-S-L family lipolytic protein [Flavobacteriaceae bacterium]
MNTKYLCILLVCLGFFACKEEDDFVDSPTQLPELTAGNADFSNFVSIGNSLTAGFTDNALFNAGQENSIPNILSQQFANVGGGSFNQPLMNDNTGGMLAGGNRILEPRYVFNGTGPAPLESVVGAVTITTDLAVNNPTGPFNNMGVSGAKVGHLLYDGYGNISNLGSTANPYFIRMASSPSATILGDALSQDPSFFSLWIGNNDVLGYALSVGESDTDADNYNPITPTNGAIGIGFQETYEYIIETLADNAQGIVANIPYVTTIPHFTTVPYNPLDPDDSNFGSQITLLNSVFGSLNQIFTAVGATDRIIEFHEDDPSAVVIKDESLTDLSSTIATGLSNSPEFTAFLETLGIPAVAAPSVANLMGAAYGQARQATSDDLLVLSSSSVIGTVNTNYYNFLVSQGLSAELAGTFAVEGITYAMDDKWVLIPSEQDEIKTATDAFNQIISNAASTYSLAFVDANILMQELTNGTFVSGNFNPSSELVMGGVFSLDGVHPNSRGYALIANEFMKRIDETYESNFEASGNLVDIGDYPTNFSPTLQ